MMNLNSALASVSGWTMASRVFGVARDVCVAATFRVGAATDAFFVAFMLPNLLRRLTAEGALSQAFVPVFNEKRKQEGDDSARKLHDEVASALLSALLILTAIGVAAAPIVIAVVVPGFSDTPGKSELASDLLRITFPYILFISMVALLSGVLNSFSRFSVPAATPTLLNFAMICATLFLAPQMERPIFALAWGVFLGGILQLGMQIFFVAKINMLPRLHWPRLGNGGRRVLKLMAQAALGVSVAQLSLIINKFIASFLEGGSVSWLYYADRLMELPAGVLGAAMATVILPGLSRCHAESQTARFSELLDWAMRLTILLAPPAACGLAILSAPLAATLFQYGEFSQDDTLMTARALSAYAVGIVGLVAVRTLAAGFHSRQNMKTPVKIAVMTLLATQAMNLIFIFALKMNHAGLTLSIGLAACLNAGLLLSQLLREGVYRPQKGWRIFIGKVAVGCAVMSAILIFASPPSEFWTQSGLAPRLATLIPLVAGGAFAYFFTLYFLGIKPAQFKARAD